MEIRAKIKRIGETEKVSEKFQKREFVVDYESGGFPQVIKFTLTQNRVNLLDNYSINDSVSITFGLQGREWTNKEGKTVVFNTLNVLELGKVESESSPQETSSSSNDDKNNLVIDNSDEDDLPF